MARDAEVLNQRSGKGMTPLMLCGAHNNIRVAKALLKATADVTLLRTGRSVLDFAFGSAASSQLVEALRGAKARTNMKPPQPWRERHPAPQTHQHHVNEPYEKIRANITFFPESPKDTQAHLKVQEWLQ